MYFTPAPRKPNASAGDFLYKISINLKKIPRSFYVYRVENIKPLDA